MGSAIFIRSYWKDLDWLHLCLRSIDRHCRGFDEVVVVVPKSSRAWIERSPLPRSVRLVYCPVYRDDYLGQQVTKLHADRYVKSALIVHVDSDCVFNWSTCPADLAPAARPRLVTRPIAELGRHYPWRAPTEAFLGFETDTDFMQQPPFVYPRWLYQMLRRHCRELHHQSVGRYITARPPRGFSEFNALGAYALRYHHDAFDFARAGTPGAPAPHCDWYWSWGGLTPQLRQKIEAGIETASDAYGRH